MRRLKILTLTFLLLCIFIDPALGGDTIRKVGEWINFNQPISAGKRIYSATSYEKDWTGAATWVLHNYVYGGADDKHIKVNFDLIIRRGDYVNVVENAVLETPLNARKRALLKAKTLSETEPVRELLITVVDKSGGIKVEEYKNR